MQVNNYFLFGLCMVLWNIYNLTNAKALIGQNVRPVREREFPYVLPLLLTGREDPIMQIIRFCSGSLISNRDILTAEHCLENLEFHRIRIHIGSDDIRYGRRYYMLWSTSYKDWTLFKDIEPEYKKNDLTIIRLSSVVPDDIKPVAISTLSNRELYGKDAQIAGWGKSNTNENPRIMETVTVRILPNRECERIGRRVQGRELKFQERILCTSADPYAFLAYGDSGDPLIYNDTIVGVSSGACLLPDVEFHPDKLNLHFGIDYYRTYILDVINNF